MIAADLGCNKVHFDRDSLGIAKDFAFA